jgi:DNA-binding beta-propeller fold protein YncE
MADRSAPRAARTRTGLARARLVSCLLLAACAPAVPAAAGAGPVLFVANAGDGTIAQIDAVGGRIGSPSLAVAGSPVQVAPGAGGSVLVLSLSATRLVSLTLFRPTSDGWTARPVALPDPANDAVMSADGSRWAAVAYRVFDPADGAALSGRPRCSLAVVDTVAAVAERTLSVCGPREVVRDLMVLGGPTGATVYVAVQSFTGMGTGRVNRVVALDVSGGRVVAMTPIDGTPTQLVGGSAAAERDGLVYCAVTTSGPEDEPPAPYRGRLLALDAETLTVVEAYSLDLAPAHVAVAPDGDRAYALFGNSVYPLDLITGRTGPGLVLPERGLAIVATNGRVYVAVADRDEVVVIDGGAERIVQRIRAGRSPVALALRGGGT